jgi:ribosomal protein L11 methyltransferase
MFTPYNWFSRIQLYGLARQEMFNWFEVNQPLYFLSHEAKPATLTDKPLSETDKILLEYLLDRGWEGVDFGGYIPGKNLSEVKGFAHFLIENSTAVLAGLAFDKTLQHVPLLQSPVLHAALTELTNEKPKIEQIFLPFLPETQEEAQALAMHNLYYEAEGYWQKRGRSYTADELLKHYTFTASAYLEVSLVIEARYVPLVVRALEQYSYKKGVVIERTTKVQFDGLEMLDELAPVTLKAYIPDGEKAADTIGNLSSLLSYFSLIFPLSEFEVNSLSNQERENLWDSKNALRVGKRFVFKLPEDTYTPKNAEVVVNLLSNDSVFGITTFGLHPSTRLPIELMEKYVDSLKHVKMLDIGIGTAILSIVAVHLGIEQILGVDAHPPAVANAQENVKINNMTDKIRVEQGSLAITTKPESYTYAFEEEALQPPIILAAYLPFDMIVSNTYDHIHIALAQPMYEALRPAGLLITSGIIITKADDVATALEQTGFKLVERKQNGNWVAFIHTK